MIRKTVPWKAVNIRKTKYAARLGANADPALKAVKVMEAQMRDFFRPNAWPMGPWKVKVSKADPLTCAPNDHLDEAIYPEQRRQAHEEHV